MSNLACAGVQLWLLKLRLRQPTSPIGPAYLERVFRLDRKLAGLGVAPTCWSLCLINETSARKLCKGPAIDAICNNSPSRQCHREFPVTHIATNRAALDWERWRGR